MQKVFIGVLLIRRKINMFLMMTVIIGILLLAVGVIDIKRKSICRFNIILLMIVCFIAFLLEGNISIYEAAGGFSIGMCAVGVSMISKEQIGRGDGFVIAALGIMLGFRECLSVICIASFVMAVVSVAVLILKKGNKNTRLPFIPALFAGYAVSMSHYYIQYKAW